MSIEILGLSAWAQSGKDAAAEILVNEYGFTRVAFADTLRSVVYALNPLMPDGRRLQDVIDEMGWDRAKVNFREARTLLQKMGTEAGRDILGENIWVDTTLNNLKPGKYVVTDCRFPNEVDAIRERFDGEIWRIVRAGVGPANSHASENSLADYAFDRWISNNSTLEDYQETIRETYEDYAKSRV